MIQKLGKGWLLARALSLEDPRGRTAAIVRDTLTTTAPGVAIRDPFTGAETPVRKLVSLLQVNPANGD